MKVRELYIKRCFDLARIGKGKASPNPLVGAVLEHNDLILSEGWHRKYGFSHAEVHAVSRVPQSKRNIIQEAKLYVSLEPCCIQGNTPPCTNLIKDSGIKKVVISCIDSTPGVAGKSLDILKQADCEIETGILSNEGADLFNPRDTFVKKKRPFIILKYAQSLDGYLSETNKQTWITNAFSKRLVHRWRSESDAIMVGTNTAMVDNPQLTNRLYYGNSPVRIVLDRSLSIPKTANILDSAAPTIVVTTEKAPSKKTSNIQYLTLPFDKHLLATLMDYLHNKNIGSLFVEGGAQLLQSFIDENLWDEARVFVGDSLIKEGIVAPTLPKNPIKSLSLKKDRLLIYKNV